MSGKCRNTEHFVTIPDKFRFMAKIYDYHVWDEDEPIVVREVEMIDYRTGSIWYDRGFKSTNYELIPKLDFEPAK